MQEPQVSAADLKPKKAKSYEIRINAAACGMVAIFIVKYSRYLNLVTTVNSSWDVIKMFLAIAIPCAIATFAFLMLLPIVVRGSNQQRLKAVVLALLAAYFAFSYWEMMIENYVING
jgi:hypothetical protein